MNTLNNKQKEVKAMLTEKKDALYVKIDYYKSIVKELQKEHDTIDLNNIDYSKYDNIRTNEIRKEKVKHQNNRSYIMKKMLNPALTIRINKNNL